MFSPYLGNEYTDKEVLMVCEQYTDEINFSSCSNKFEEAANSIASGRIIGWFQGRSECGPRALGNRSILADARNKNMKEILNARVKFREHFRPFAPSILFEYQEEFFDLDIPSPYMLMVADIFPAKQNIIPAVTHVDGTGRLQTVLRELNPTYHRLIESFYELTGVPVVLNTSFNVNKEPIVETPEHAIRCFLISDFDELYIENIFITKKRKEL